MKIIIIGGGKVGYTLAENLSQEEHDITIIDRDEEALRRASENLDVMYIVGNGASMTILRDAGAVTADVLIAVTTNDEVNMLCCIISKKLGTKHTIARIRDHEYVRDVSSFKRQLDIDLVINPERSTAHEIMRLLRFPSAGARETFSRGRVELISFRAVASDKFVGSTVQTFRAKTDISFLVCIVERDGKVFIPHGDFVFESDDVVYVAGKFADLSKLFRSIGRTTNMVSDVMLLGGGRITHYLSELALSTGIKPTIVEINPEVCEKLAGDIPNATVILADGTDQDILESENIRGMDAFVALTGRDEDNMMISLFAQQCGVGKIIIKANHTNYVSLIKSLGIDSILSPKEITANHILHFIRGLENSKGGAVESLYRFSEGRVEALEFIIRRDFRYLDVKIKELPLKGGLLIAVISRGGKSFIPKGEDCFEEGDSVVIITLDLGFNDISDIFMS